MRPRTTLLAGALCAMAAGAPASAAPDRSGALNGLGEKFEWTSDVATGAVYTSSVSSRVPACSPVFSCDTTLIEVGALDEPADLQVSIAGVGLGGQDTMKDIDLHVYESDAGGTQGELLGESTGATADELVTVYDAQPGYYLIYVDWYLGAGSASGLATLTDPEGEDF